MNSNVSPALAPPGRHLVSVSINRKLEDDDAMLVEGVLSELEPVFGSEARAWRWLRTYRIPRALPAFPAGALPGPMVEERGGVLHCGDALAHPSLQGAMSSGARAAARLMERL